MRPQLRLLIGLSLPALYACGGDDTAHGDSGTETEGSAETEGSSQTDGSTDTLGTGGGTMGSTGDGTDSTGTDSADTTAGETGGVCGDGETDAGEECDDGNTDPGDGCDENCQVEDPLETCGDGNTDRGEECDDGNNDPDDGCSPTCQLEMPEACGNGDVDPGEECDDGNTDPGDGCSPTCQNEVSASCGDGNLDAGEECDDGNDDDDDACLSSCVAATCGDGVVWSGHETCDDGNTNDGDDCSASCISELCGNGMIDLDEECDNGGANGTPGNACYDTCIHTDVAFDVPLVFHLDLQTRGDGPRAIEAGDFNGDGVLDLATVNQTSSDTTVLYGFGDGRFWAPHRRLAQNSPHDVELADLDDDGRLDAIVANEGSDTVSVFMGEGAAFGPATHVSVQFAGVGFDPRGLAVADVDGDGALDVVVANQDSNTVSILTGDGAGGLVATASLGTFVGVDGMGPIDVEVADVNDDGELDIVTCNPNSDDVTLLPGLGMGNFGAATTFTTRVGAGGDNPEAIILADVSGDGVPDAIVAASVSDDISVLVANPGTGGFDTPVRFSTRVGADGDLPQGVAVGDVDGDGEPDVVTANGNTDDVTVLIGVAGGATFLPPAVFETNEADISGVAGDAPRGIGLHDMDSDGDLDIVTSNTTSDDVTVLLNDGAGVFAAPMNFESRVGWAGEDPRALAIGDINADGVPDVVVANQDTGDMTAVAGLGEGILAPAQTTPVIGSFPQGIALADVTGEGRLDWVATQTNNNTLGRGSQGVGGQFFLASYFIDDGPIGISIGDLDGDDDLDVVTATFDDNEISRVLNTGVGAFSSVASFAASSGTRDVALADVTGDGNLDAVSVSNNSDHIRVFPGNGAGSFAASSTFTTQLSTSGRRPWFVDIADLTGDGLLDVVTANADSNDVSLLTNAGGGIYMDPVIIPATFDVGDSDTLSVRVGDFDGDGVLDLATANRNRDSFSIIFGFGGGSFSGPQEFMTGAEPHQLAVGDFNGDGMQDVATANFADDTVSVHLSQGH
jgi:cysteine-rich repeat protein